MDPKETACLIELAGGHTAFARLLGLDKQPGYLQRVNNWKRRGIPARIALEHRPAIEALKRKSRAA